MNNKITPKDQSVKLCLKDRRYYIDFYQREYVWSDKTVLRLLDDIFFPFDLSYEEHKNQDLNEAVLDKYNWYYLNIFITNDVDGHVYIVDGQQRLTTLTLIAAKLYHLIEDHLLKNTLKDCIYGEDIWKGNIFRIDSERRRNVMNAVLEESEYSTFANKTEENIIARYKDISKYIDDKQMDAKKLKTFVYYFLERLVLVELKIEKDDTPMIFEVINDRGEALKPFEILKGKMVGALDKTDTEKYSNIWDESFNQLRDIEDAFFSDYLKSQFVYRRNSKLEKDINNLYHRFIYEDNDIANRLAFRRRDPNYTLNIKDFIQHNLVYYAALYAKIRKNADPYLFYNKDINERDSQYQMIMAACALNDPQEADKIHNIAKELDRLYVALVLNGIYDSNRFMEISYSLNEKLHNADITEYRHIFDDIIRNEISEIRKISDVPSLLEYDYFIKKDYSNLNIRFLRYLYARVEDYLCMQMKVKPANDIQYISTRTGDVGGYHIEHILSRNETNKGYFETEDEFNIMRNQLGGLLLLKGRNNISSGNEEYNDKLKTYSNGLNWGRTLTSDFYHCNKDFEDFNDTLEKEHKVRFQSIAIFDKSALEKRNKLLYELVKIIWEID